MNHRQAISGYTPETLMKLDRELRSMRQTDWVRARRKAIRELLAQHSKPNVKPFLRVGV